MDVQAILFQDQMDLTRFMRIVEEKPNTVIAKVFFGPNKSNLNYSGKVELPKRLFYPDGFNRVGFCVAQDPVPVKPRREYRERDDDEERPRGRRYED